MRSFPVLNFVKYPPPGPFTKPPSPLSLRLSSNAVSAFGSVGQKKSEQITRRIVELGGSFRNVISLEHGNNETRNGGAYLLPPSSRYNSSARLSTHYNTAVVRSADSRRSSFK